ncbi:hypothetical protein OHA61_22040 [Streptomyces sp. NBC_00885]|uniref:GTP pyrophosphokinase n=1 Tax=Streptomyces sp. NBC_00885 TaxID=2975857 RepID=UPI0038652F09|nr:hypothetical protein OHA61_22040 [Streptomyces sp. NBC_00885]
MIPQTMPTFYGVPTSDARRPYSMFVEIRTYDALADQYRSRRKEYEALCEELEFSLKKKLNDAGIKWHSITSRVKELESFLEKVERKEYADPFGQAEDLAGARIVCLFMLDLDRVGEVISAIFDVLDKEDKINEGEASAFGYMSHHYICKLSDRYSGERYDSIKGMKFEIQVRTILMDAWANMSHYLSYKNEESIPQDLVKDFHALSGLLYVGDRHFEALFKSSSRSAATAVEKVLRSPEVQESEVNSDTVQALLERVFPDRRPASSVAVSEFTSELREAGFLDLAEVGRILLGDREKAIASEERRNSKVKDGETRFNFNRVGLAREVFDLHSPEFKKVRVDKRRKRSERRIRRES